MRSVAGVLYWMCAALVMAALWHSSASANTLSEDFSATTFKDSGTAVWNIEQGTIHPNLQVTGWQVGGGDPISTGDNFSVGDGRDGAFNSSTYSNFGTVTNGTITINALDHPILQFTRFKLDNGYTLTAINGPLIIYSLAEVEIVGNILCSGRDAVGTAPGEGRCGGGNGGTGGAVGESGERGYPRSGNVQAGFGATYNGPAEGGGGGGGGSGASSGNTGSNDTSNANTAGALGATTTPDHAFTTNIAGGGGGGGSGSNIAVTGTGGGGGGGGGSVIIHAVGNITVDGTILARGGSGAATTTGGGGGGGGGGSIKLFTAGAITLTQAGIPVDVTEGSRGTPTGATAGMGGNGASGRTWLISSTFSNPSGGSESHPAALNAYGSFQYSNGTGETIITKAYDTRSTMAQFESVAVSPTSNEIVVLIAGSNDGFVSDDSGWKTLAELALLKDKRYVRFHVTLTNGNATNPTKLTGLTVTFNPGQKQEFNFKSSCGTVTGAPPPSFPNLLFLLCLLMAPFILGFGLRAIPIKSN